MDCIAAAQEVTIISQCYRRKEAGVVLKVVVKKAYDLVSWDFVVEMLNARGFGDKWTAWFAQCLHSSHTPVMVNGEKGKLHHQV